MSLRSIHYVTSSQTLDTGYDTFLIDASSGNITFTLDQIYNDGENYWIKRTDSSSNTVTIEGNNSSETIDGQVSINLNPGDRIIVVSTDSSTWVIF